jgi:hypothetical protein
MSTLKTTFIQHPSATEPSIELSSDGSIVLPLSGIGDLADVDEGSGAADGDVLTYDGVGNVWSPAAPAGAILQVVTAKDTTERSTGSSAYVDANLSLSITPVSATSKIYLSWSYSVVAQRTTTARTWVQAFVALADGDNNLITDNYHIIEPLANVNNHTWAFVAQHSALIDSVDTSARTYKARFGIGGGFTNLTVTLRNNVTPGVLVAMEIAS